MRRGREREREKLVEGVVRSSQTEEATKLPPPGQ
jgi:hypothetical protein